MCRFNRVLVLIGSIAAWAWFAGLSPSTAADDTGAFPDADLTFKLEAKFSRWELAGGGRFLVFHLKEAKKVVLLDLVSGKVALEVPRVPDDLLIAGGAEKLVLVMPGQRLMQRWSLTNMEREKISRISGDDIIKKALLGASATDQGPLLLAGKQAVLYDLRTLKPLTVRFSPN